MAHPHDSPFHSFLAKMEVAVEMDVSLNRASKPAIEKCYKNLIHQCSIITVTFCIEEQELGVYIQETGEHSVPRGTVKK
jgi:hypothetical protein